MIYLDRCQRIEIAGITTLNPPNTHISIRNSTEITIHDFTASAPGNSPNTDALNLSSVKNVLIENCKIATGDDNIVFLCGHGSNPEAERVENVTIRDCQLGVGHGLSIGSYTSGGVRDVTIDHVTFDGTTSGIRFKAWRDRGGAVERITYRDIKMKNVQFPIYISSYYPREPDGPAQDLPAPGHASNPIWQDIKIQNVTITGARTAAILWGLPDAPITRIGFDNVHVSAQQGALIFHAKDIVFKDSSIKPAAGPALQTYDAAVNGIDSTPFPGGPANFK